MDKNELIHKFTGHDWRKEQFQWRPGAVTPMTLDHLNYYRKSWDWLMPVVTKIICEKFEDGENVYLRTFGMINEENGNLMVRFNRHGLFEAETLLEATYLAVCDYVSALEKTEAKPVL